MVNVFAGKNNVGKTAFIEGLWRFFQGGYQGPGRGDSSSDSGITQQIPAGLDLEIELGDGDPMRTFLQGAGVANRTVSVSFSGSGGRTTLEGIWLSRLDPREGCLIKKQEPGRYDTDRGRFANIEKTAVDTFSALRQAVMFLSWRRSVPRQENAESQRTVDSTASNLNSFLLSLHNNNERAFDMITSTFCDIFPEIQFVGTRIDAQRTTIVVGCEGSPETIPLYECGSGMTQVLIMLCILFAERQRLVLFDEPHACLHPAAEKAVYDLVAAQDEHQFVFTTHSPILINYPASKHLYLVTKDRGLSMYTPLVEMDRAFAEIGLSNSDFAFADRAVFVEGDTEEKVLPVLLDHFGVKQLGYNYRIINMGGTDDRGSMRKRMARYRQVLFRTT